MSSRSDMIYISLIILSTRPIPSRFFLRVIVLSSWMLLKPCPRTLPAFCQIAWKRFAGFQQALGSTRRQNISPKNSSRAECTNKRQELTKQSGKKPHANKFLNIFLLIFTRKKTTNEKKNRRNSCSTKRNVCILSASTKTVHCERTRAQRERHQNQQQNEFGCAQTHRHTHGQQQQKTCTKVGNSTESQWMRRNLKNLIVFCRLPEIIVTNESCGN